MLSLSYLFLIIHHHLIFSQNLILEEEDYIPVRIRKSIEKEPTFYQKNNENLPTNLSYRMVETVNSFMKLYLQYYNLQSVQINHLIPSNQIGLQCLSGLHVEDDRYKNPISKAEEKFNQHKTHLLKIQKELKKNLIYQPKEGLFINQNIIKDILNIQPDEIGEESRNKVILEHLTAFIQLNIYLLEDRFDEFIKFFKTIQLNYLKLTQKGKKLTSYEEVKDFLTKPYLKVLKLSSEFSCIFNLYQILSKPKIQFVDEIIKSKIIQRKLNQFRNEIRDLKLILSEIGF